MKRVIVSLILVAFWAVSAAAAGQKMDDFRYIIRPNDKLKIIVWPYKDLYMDMTVRPDGMISYPFIGEFKVDGMTAGELGEKLAESVSEYVHEPKVAVNIEEFRSPRVYVLGQVKNPGQYDIRKGDTILDAITDAGGPAERAWTKKVGLIRASEEIEENKAKVVEVNLANLLGKGEIPEEYFLADGDIIYIPETTKPNWDKISKIVSTFYQTFSIEDILRRNF